MFGLEESEVQERRRYVAYVRKEVEVRSLSITILTLLTIHFSQVQNMRAELNTEHSISSRNLPSYSSSSQSQSGQNTPRIESGRDQDDDHQEAWAREEQQVVSNIPGFVCSI